ncbi:MAG: cytochrome biosis protein [Gemmatimonadetes bacterium]|nr:cytochrome biosis protein [Gemmatimonadota bacterium]
MRRRDFLRGLSVAGIGGLLAPRRAAQEGAGPAQGSTSNRFDLDQAAAKTVRRPPKTDARSSMNDEERDALEHQIRCQCGCTLDVYTCRTTDFSCQVSPAMHRDVISLVEGGYSAQEILDAFVSTYGERALMAPKREGFNLAGYVVPFAALAVGLAGLVYVLRGMQRRTAVVAAAKARTAKVGVRATTDELSRLDAAIRRDD